MKEEKDIQFEEICDFCGKPATRKGRIKESPKDEFGVLVPLCERCYRELYGNDD